MVASIIKAATLLAASSRLANGLTLDVSSADSIKSASSAIAKSVINLYNNFQQKAQPYEAGTFGMPYYWWESAMAWGALIDYRTVTGDTSYDANVSKALVAQIGTNKDYMPAAQTKGLGNDDQAFWALAAMDALEYGFANPSNVTWLQLATNVWAEQTARWDTETCNGGLRWQIYEFNAGYSYKNVNSNGAYFQLSARLARYTGNQTYAEWANKSYDWMQQTGLITSRGAIYDGTDANLNCTQVNHIEWTINEGFLLYGSAVLYNTTGSDTWRGRVQTFVEYGSELFFTNSTQIMTEQACESVAQINCNTDQLAFKSAYARWLAKSAIVAPAIKATVSPLLQSSAKAAATSCGDAGDQCKAIWYNLDSNAKNPAGGLGQELSALSAIQSLLILGPESYKAQPLTQSSAPANGTYIGGATNTTAGPVKQTGAATRSMPESIIGIVLMTCLAMIAL